MSFHISLYCYFNVKLRRNVTITKFKISAQKLNHNIYNYLYGNNKHTSMYGCVSVFFLSAISNNFFLERRIINCNAPMGNVIHSRKGNNSDVEWSTSIWLTVEELNTKRPRDCKTNFQGNFGDKGSSCEDGDQEPHTQSFPPQNAWRKKSIVVLKHPPLIRSYSTWLLPFPYHDESRQGTTFRNRGRDWESYDNRSKHVGEE
jgi:hypothetical protein